MTAESTENRAHFLNPRGQTFGWLLVCFACSGMSGLIYEIAWVRSLELIFGTTTFAVATVLASFMGGLAFGSYAMGRLVTRWERFHPLKVYALIEVAIALVALLIPFAFGILVPAYQILWKFTQGSFVVFTLVRFVLSALVVVIPTFLMGATLPIVSNYVGRDAVVGNRRTGFLYSVNTLGAVLGCAGAGLLLFPLIGLKNTQWVAIGLNILAAAGAWQLAVRNPWINQSQSLPAEAGPLSLKDEAPPAHRYFFVLIYAISGFVAMGYEVAWNRALIMVLGSSTYAYTIMLATFLAGLALGAWGAARFLPRSVSPLLLAGGCQLFIALSTYGSVFLLEEMPYLYLRLSEALDPGPLGLLNLQFVLSASLMILPTLGLGAMFPITIQGLQGIQTAPVVGWAYAWNTAGAIVGSLAAGFWLVPFFGAQQTLLGGIALNSLIALAAFYVAMPRRFMRLRVALPLLAVAFCVNLFASTPKWDPAVMSSGVFRYGAHYAGLDRAAFRDRARKIGEILLYKEGLSCTVTVTRNVEMTSLLVNGKPDASTPSGLNPITAQTPQEGLYDLPTQMLLGHIPMLLAQGQDDVLVIGLGSGVTLGSVLTHPVKRVECIELENAVVQASRLFDDYNGQPLNDPRTQLVVNDARNHLLLTDRHYDVIISEPSNPWIPGAATLFTKEAFALSRSRLRPDGLFCQWLQVYELEESHFQTLLQTFLSVFPEVHLFRVNHDALLIGSTRPLPMQTGTLNSRLTAPVQKDLSRIYINTLADLFARYWVSGSELKRALPPAKLNTDDNMLIEFAAPLQVLVPKQRQARRSLGQFFETTGALGILQFDPSENAANFWSQTANATMRLQAFPQAVMYANAACKTNATPEAIETLAAAFALAGDREKARVLLTEAQTRYPQAEATLRGLARLSAEEEQWKAAKDYSLALLSTAGTDPVALYCLGRSQYHLGETQASLQNMEQIKHVHSDPKLPFYLGMLYSKTGRLTEAAEQLRIFLKSQKADLIARTELAGVLQRAGNLAAASAQWQIIGRLTSAEATRLSREAERAERQGNSTEANRLLEQALQLDTNNTDLALLLARRKQIASDLEGAVKVLQAHLQTNPDRPEAVGFLGQLLADQKHPDAARIQTRYRALAGQAWQPLTVRAREPSAGR